MARACVSRRSPADAGQPWRSKQVFSSWPSMTVPRDAVCSAIAGLSRRTLSAYLQRRGSGELQVWRYRRGDTCSTVAAVLPERRRRCPDRSDRSLGRATAGLRILGPVRRWPGWCSRSSQATRILGASTLLVPHRPGRLPTSCPRGPQAHWNRFPTVAKRHPRPRLSAAAFLGLTVTGPPELALVLGGTLGRRRMERAVGSAGPTSPPATST
jgi:hypothetical protein